jgi:translocation and assembly module TamB
VEVSGLTLAALRSGVVLLGDDLTFEEALTIPALGGEVRFDALRIEDLLAPSRHLRAGVLVTGVSLEETARAFALPALEGSVEALFPAVRLDATTLRVEGGGEVRLGDISGEDVLSRFPKLRLSAEFSGIDLGRVTRTFDFGEMNGVVEGYVRDLRLFRGVPVSFEAAIHSVPTAGVPQNVNVKAVRNLTILGTGARISPLDRGLQRFFDKYTYAELGVWMQLQADVFVLRGNAGRQGGRELFVRGRLPFPINIVNAQPGKTISFSSMVERVKSVDFAAAQTAP